MSDSIFDWLQEQPAAVVTKLYGRQSNSNSNATNGNSISQAPFVTKAVFQSLSALAKNYVMRLLFVEQAVTCKELGDWISGGYRRREHLAAMEELIKLNILQEEDPEGDIMDVDGIDTTTGDGDTAVVIDEDFEHVKTAKYAMNAHFRQSFKQGLASPEEPWALQKAMSSLPQHENAKTAPTKADLERTSQQKWDALLRFLVKIEGASAVTPGGAIDNFVCRTGLMKSRGATPKSVDLTKRTRALVQGLHITAKGYEYMLKSYQQQVWLFVFQTIERHEESRDELLSLLFMLSYCEFGAGYPLQALTQTQQEIIAEFADVGLVHFPNSSSASGDHGDVLFYPSSIAINMMFKSFGPTTQSLHSRTEVGYEDQQSLKEDADGANAVRSTLGLKINRGMGVGGEPAVAQSAALATAAHGQGASSSSSSGAPPPLTSGLQIIVETNMQVVAYLTSPLHLALLGLFVEFSVQMPNVAIGKISRDKAKDAFDLGIRVDQIIDFLCVHAHPLTKNEKPVIPTNVVDQLVLWESEKFRVKDTESILVDFTKVGGNTGFGASAGGLTREQYMEVESQARRIKACLFSDEKQMVMVLTYDGYDQIRAYVEDKFGIL